MQKLNEMLQDANDVYKKTVEENNRLKQIIIFKVGHVSLTAAFKQLYTVLG